MSKVSSLIVSLFYALFFTQVLPNNIIIQTKSCSLNCYKTHKDACLTKQSANESNQNTEETTQNDTTTTRSIQVESISKIIPEETEFKDVSSDFVSADKLKLLGIEKQIFFKLK